MTDEVALLPLPEGYDKYSPPRLHDGQMFHEGQMRAYARANSARTIALLQAEIEALRAEVGRLNRILGRIVEGDDGSTVTIHTDADAFAAAREYLLGGRH